MKIQTLRLSLCKTLQRDQLRQSLRPAKRKVVGSLSQHCSRLYIFWALFFPSGFVGEKHFWTVFGAMQMQQSYEDQEISRSLHPEFRIRKQTIQNNEMTDVFPGRAFEEKRTENHEMHNMQDGLLSGGPLQQ